MKIFLKLTFLITTIIFTSCKTSKFPVCTKLSNTKQSNIEGISTTLLKVCNERKISITVLSSTIIELRGSIRQMKWLQNNYHILMCDFDQTKISLDESTYTSCMSNAKDWIKIVQTNRPDSLMIDRTIFCPNCCE
jgi:hypothetical protein